MVWLPRDDLVRAVELLEQDDARELVRQRHAAEAEAHVAALEVEAPRTADDEAEVAAGLPALLEEAAELDRVVFVAVGREKDDEGALRDAAVDALVLAHLDQLEAGVAGEELLVVLDVVRVRRAEPADGYEERAHCPRGTPRWEGSPLGPAVSGSAPTTARSRSGRPSPGGCRRSPGAGPAGRGRRGSG